MNILYDLAFILFAVFYIPAFLLKRRKRKGMALRLGIYPEELRKKLTKRKNIWVHAVSVGEVMAISPLLDRLRQSYPDLRLVITTVTETGNLLAKKIAKKDEIVLFLPLDITFSVKRAVLYISPVMLIIAETELWPNLISVNSDKNIPVILVNGRISDESFGRYNIIRFMLKPFLNKIRLFCMQTDTEKERIISLGADPLQIKVTGNMKFDSSMPQALPDENANVLASALNLGEARQLLVAGSTHPGEEEIIISAYSSIRKKFSGLKLLIAPRHIERASEIERIVIANGFVGLRVSELMRSGQVSKSRRSNEIFILDSIGQLKDCYSLAELVFVGGSLVKKGGQNIIEPAALAKPVLFGPHTFNFRNITKLLLEEEAAVMIRDKASFEDSCLRLLKSSSLRSRIGTKAKEIVDMNRGASDSTMEAIDETVSL